MASRYQPWESHLDLLFHPCRTNPSWRREQSGCLSHLLFPTALLDWNTSHRYLHPSSLPKEQVFTWEAACICEKAEKGTRLCCSCIGCWFWATSEAFCSLSVEMPVTVAAFHAVLSHQWDAKGPGTQGYHTSFPFQKLLFVTCNVIWQGVYK